jgi:Flp pilus assembly protein TadG
LNSFNTLNRLVTMKRIAKSLRPSSERNRGGTAVVETAIVLPLFLLVVMGVIEFGRAFMVAQLLTNAAREGAREAITAGSTNEAVIAKVVGLVSSTCKVPADKVNVAISVNDSTSANLTTAARRDMCEVQVNVQVGDISLIPVKFLTGAKLRGQAAMRHE